MKGVINSLVLKIYRSNAIIVVGDNNAQDDQLTMDYFFTNTYNYYYF